MILPSLNPVASIGARSVVGGTTTPAMQCHGSQRAVASALSGNLLTMWVPSPNLCLLVIWLQAGQKVWVTVLAWYIRIFHIIIFYSFIFMSLSSPVRCSQSQIHFLNVFEPFRGQWLPLTSGLLATTLQQAGERRTVQCAANVCGINQPPWPMLA